MKIFTKIIKATNTSGTRVRATGGRRQVTLSWDYSQNRELNHARAALALANAGNFPGLLVEVGPSRVGGIEWKLTSQLSEFEGAL